MKELAKNYLKKFGPSFLFSKKSYAQEGEDLVVNRFLEGQKNGFYVEVGAHHPYRFSNTYFFYKKGWSGICIDPLPGTKKAFNKARPRDVALEVGISISPGKLEYYMFNEPALNTFDPAVAKIRDGKKGFRVIDTLIIETKPLATILADLKIPDSGIDLMSVDVEGFDYQVLSSFDWDKNHPKVIIAESDNTELVSIQSDPIYSLLLNKGYKLYAKTGHSLIFIY